MEYIQEYERWLNYPLKDLDLKNELKQIADQPEEIQERFAVALQFGTAGLRGTLGAGTNRMNVHVVAWATQGVANWVKTQGGNQSVAISYDTRLKGDYFSKTVACVLAANGIQAILYPECMPVPALSFATRYYHCNAGIMVTASHNPAKYNGYKAYGPDGCQMTDQAAKIVYEEMLKIDVLDGPKTMDFAKAVDQGLIRFVDQACYDAFYQAILAQQLRPNIVEKSGLKLVYSPLNGTGKIPVTTILEKMGIKDISLVYEQAYPNGYFSTCSYPNPEIFEALKLGLEQAKKQQADLMLATDPDADRVGIAMKDGDQYTLVSGNQMGALLLDYICSSRIAQKTMPKDPVAVMSIVSTPLADEIAKYYGVELRHTLTGFKWIGDQIAQLEQAGQVERFIFGFEESYGYLAGSHVRDKDAVVASMLIVEMAAYYRSIGSSIAQRLQQLYEQFGYYLNVVTSKEFDGLHGMEKMKDIMATFRHAKLDHFGSWAITKQIDYQNIEETGLPFANVLEYHLEDGSSVMVRPSGTEPKMKTYYSIKAENEQLANQKVEQLKQIIEQYYQ